MILTPEELAALVEHAVHEYPRESCGVIVVRGDERRVIRCRNIQDDLHRRDPVRHPRDARTAYYIDPLDLLRIGRLEGEGFAIAVIYHSHADAGAYFSETDRTRALVGDEPAYPDTTYVVTSVRAGRPEAVAAFRWDAAARDFVPMDVGLALPVTPEGCP
jgi:proteasome lid subunit RPN8/RPN11